MAEHTALKARALQPGGRIRPGWRLESGTGNVTPMASDPKRVTRSLLVILLLGAALRVGACVMVSPTPLMNDEVLYHKLPARVAAGEALADAGGRTPGLIVFHAALYRAFGDEVAVARAGNVVLSVATIALVFLLGRRMAGDRAGLIAAALAAAYPVLIAFSHYLLTETLYVFLLLAALASLVAGKPQPTSLRAAAAGALFGLLALTREVGLVAPPVAAAYLVWTARPRPGGGLRLAGILVASTMLVVAPWSVYLNGHSESLVLVSRTTWLNLYLGNHEGAHFLRYRELGEDRGARERAARELAVAAVSERMPTWPLEKTVGNVPDLLRPTAFPVRRLLQRPDSEVTLPGALGSWAYRFRWDALDRAALRTAAAASVGIAYLALLFTGTAGLVLSRERRLAALLAAVALAHVVPVILTFPNTRFRLPIMPLLIVGAAALLVSPSASWRTAGRARRVTAVAALLVLLVCIVSEGEAWLSPTLF